MKIRQLHLVLTCVLFLGSIAMGASSAPKLMNYQGLLLDSNGDPVSTCVSITFTVYDAAAGGAVLWQETHSSVCPDEGHFDVLLGNGDAKTELGDDVFSGPNRWLGVAVGVDPELTPRTQLVTGPYSHRVSTVDGAAAGAIVGSVEIIPDVAKLSDGSLVIRGAGSCDAVTINPTADVALEATNDNCEQVLFMGAANSGGVLEVNATDAVKALTRTVQIDPAQGLALRATEQGGEETVSITSQNTGAALYVSSTDAAKALARTVEISPADNVVLRSRESNGDETVSITSNPQGGTVYVTSTDVAKALTRKIEIAPAQGVAMRVTEENDDDVFLLSSDENGAMLEVNSSNALKAEKAVTGSVLIQPSNNIALQAKDGSGNVQMEALTDPGGSSFIIYEVSKDGKAATKKLELTKDALFFYDNTGTEEMFKVDADGNVFSRGQVIAGQPIAKDQRAFGAWSTVLGFNNLADGDSATATGGYANLAVSRNSTVAGGTYNVAGSTDKLDSYNETVSGGANNAAIGRLASVAGGGHNAALGWYATVSGGTSDTADGEQATVGGGHGCTARGFAPTVGGGYINLAEGQYATVAGGSSNHAASSGTVAGGSSNFAYSQAAVAGGVLNSADGQYSAIGGGQSNEITNLGSVIAGGRYNNVHGQFSFIGGGGGYYEADSNTVNSSYSVIPGGRGNYTGGHYSFASGRRARALHQGALVWADHEDTDFASERDDQARFRADGGFKIDDGTSWVDMRDDGTYLIQTSTGANLTLAGVWSSKSDRASKENFTPIDGTELLKKLAQLEITEWNYKVENDGVRHIGPMAQDFYRIFGVGTDNKSIGSLDPSGIALAAIQELQRKNQDLEARLSELQALVNQLLSERQ